MFETQFLQNVESFVLMKWINLPIKLIEKYNENWKINFSDLWRYLTTEQDWKIEFINNQNVLLDKAVEYEQTQITKISSITNIPMDFLW
jgi:DNA-dependent RNA polymerase auxiliary subunit epsilon